MISTLHPRDFIFKPTDVPINPAPTTRIDWIIEPNLYVELMLLLGKRALPLLAGGPNERELVPVQPSAMN
jgi:hypothetical protein